MNWSRGLFRLWLLFAVLWVAGWLSGAAYLLPIRQDSPQLYSAASPLQEFRRQYPEYNDLADRVLADRLYQKYYSDMPRKEFDRRVSRANDISINLAETVSTYLAVIILPPAGLFIAGASLLWAIGGFRSQ